MKVDINTKMITLIGTPLGQSFAARMQNKGYEAAGLNMLYFYTEADNEHLKEIVNGIRYMTIIDYDKTFFDKVLAVQGVKDLYASIDKQVNGLGTTLVKELEKAGK